MAKIIVQNTEITVLSHNDKDSNKVKAVLLTSSRTGYVLDTR